MIIIQILEKEYKGIGRQEDYREYKRIEINGNNVHIVQEDVDPEGTWTSILETDVQETAWHDENVSIYIRP